MNALNTPINTSSWCSSIQACARGLAVARLLAKLEHFELISASTVPLDFHEQVIGLSCDLLMLQSQVMVPHRYLSCIASSLQPRTLLPKPPSAAMSDQHAHSDNVCHADEFMVLKGGQSIVPLLRRYEAYGALAPNVRIFGSSGHLTRPPNTTNVRTLRNINDQPRST